MCYVANQIEIDMPTLSPNLELNKCPHCRIDNPNLVEKNRLETRDHKGSRKRIWSTYSCVRCGGVVTASSNSVGGEVLEHYPENPSVDESLPNKAKAFLKQAFDTVHAPAGCIMLCASSVDAMLKEKGYSDGSLYSRIKEASVDHLITEEMKIWADQIRLDANDQRHADENAGLPEEKDAQRTLEFTVALGEYLFVLPNKVTRGIHRAGE